MSDMPQKQTREKQPSRGTHMDCYSLLMQLSGGGEKCTMPLCVWKPAFVKSSDFTDFSHRYAVIKLPMNRVIASYKLNYKLFQLF